MFFFLYATCVAAVLFDVGTSVPVPQFAPTQSCPNTHYLQNGACYLRTEAAVTQPCSSCQTAPAPVSPVTLPCSVAAPPCQATVPQPCPVAVPPPCQTAVGPFPPVTAPCLVTPPCLAAAPPCQSAFAPTPPVTPPYSAPTLPCQTAVAPPQPCASSQTAPCQVPYQLPCSQQPPTTICPTTPPALPPAPTTAPTTTTTTTTTTSTTTAAPRPDPIIKCPIGTILINGYCHLLYCGSGIYREGKCIVTVCPDGAVWTGSRCEIPVPQNHTTLNMSNLVITNVNQTNVNHQLNYTSNISIYITESPEPETVTTTPCPQLSTTSTPQPTLAPRVCCIVVTPSTCKLEGDRHVCRSQRYRRCGSICTHGYIYLKPPTVVVPPPPPPATPCMYGGCDYDQGPFYPDCSRCDNMTDEFCREYCHETTCQKRRCQSVDLRGYCGSYPGAIGCRYADGCTQDWCEGY